MPFTHTDKNKGDLIKSEDWNNLSKETERLGSTKLDISGGNITGDLKIEGDTRPGSNRNVLQIGDRWIFHDGGHKYIGFNSYFDNSIKTTKRFTDSEASEIRFTNDGTILLSHIKKSTKPDKLSIDVDDTSNVYIKEGNITANQVTVENFVMAAGESKKVNIKHTVEQKFDSLGRETEINRLLRINMMGGDTKRLAINNKDSYIFRIGHFSTIIEGVEFTEVFSINDGGIVKAKRYDPPSGDYAEFFESESGDALPIGVSVVIGVNGKVRPAQKGELPIGIISNFPGVLGNSPIEWPGKYVRDDYGNQIMETVESEVPKSEEAAVEWQGIIEKGGEITIKDRTRLLHTIKESRPVINPEYDPEKAYIPREERPEWQKVGLLGQLHLTKGQPVAPSWVKMKDISDAVELWLVK